MGYTLMAFMIVISIVFFRDLRLKRVLIFNGVFFATPLLLFLHVPEMAIMAIQAIIAVSYFTTAKMA